MQFAVNVGTEYQQVPVRSDKMSRKLGCVTITYQMLETALKLKEGQEIVRVYENADNYGFFCIVISGEGMPEYMEGCKPTPVDLSSKD